MTDLDPALEAAHSEIAGVLVARMIIDFHRTFRDIYGSDVMTSNLCAVGPLQSLIGLAIKNGHLSAAPQAEIDRLREALDELERVRPGAFWLLGKGRTSEKEPLFGFQILFGTDDVLADGEGETAADAIRAAVSRLHPETPNGGQRD